MSDNKCTNCFTPFKRTKSGKYLFKIFNAELMEYKLCYKCNASVSRADQSLGVGYMNKNSTRKMKKARDEMRWKMNILERVLENE